MPTRRNGPVSSNVRPHTHRIRASSPRKLFTHHAPRTTANAPREYHLENALVMQSLILRALATLLILIASNQANAQPDSYTIYTFKNGMRLGTRIVTVVELRESAAFLTTRFQDQSPSYLRLVTVAKSMTAKDRCFNLYSSRSTLAAVQAGMLDASPNAEEFLKNSAASIDEVNRQTQVTCEMR